MAKKSGTTIHEKTFMESKAFNEGKYRNIAPEPSKKKFSSSSELLNILSNFHSIAQKYFHVNNTVDPGSFIK